MSTEELDARTSTYQIEYQSRKRYNQALRERAMTALNPVLDQESTQPDAREQLEEILAGNIGRIQVSEHALEALSEAGLLEGSLNTTEQTDDPGWQHLKEDRHSRYLAYSVRLPRDLKEGFSVASVGIRLSAEVTPSTRRFDFTRWVLERP